MKKIKRNISKANEGRREIISDKTEERENTIQEET